MVSSTQPGLTMTNDRSDVNDAIEQYGRTCSIIFGKTSSSQIRYLQASIDVQQSLLTSCDSTIAKQMDWLDNFARRKNNNNDKSKTWLEIILEPFLRNYSAAVEASMAMLFHMILLAINLKIIRRQLIFLTNRIFPDSRFGIVN
jgi:hypothetical protein